MAAADGVLLPPAAMGAVDRAAIAAGPARALADGECRPGGARAITGGLRRSRMLVLCGPGNNGGDGFGGGATAASGRLARSGGDAWSKVQALEGDAAWAAAAGRGRSSR